MKHDVFISYSRKDTAVADEITRALDAAGISYFIDRQGISGGMEFPVALAHAIVESRVFLFLASRNAYVSKFTNNEITFAFNKKEKNCILPYIIDDSQLPLEMEFVFAGINWRTRYEHPIDTLVSDLCALLGKAERSSISKFREAELKEWWRKGTVADDNRDYAEAFKWYHKAAENGYLEAQVKIGFLYTVGSGVEQDMRKAVIWYQKAAERGYAKAQFNLGVMYDNGYGVSQDKAEAITWYRKAAEQGYIDAQFNLGVIYDKGDGAEQNKCEAAKWYRKAAEQGDSTAQFKLGMMCKYGQGVYMDRREATHWFRKAADQGHEGAQKALKLMS